MIKFKPLISLVFLALAAPVSADELLVEVEGSAMKTASLPANVYEARAIANALQSIVQSGAQSLDSFSLVENGKVLFDQISAKSQIDIAGYRVISTNRSGDKFSAKLEVLLIPTGNKKSSLSCRQPTNLDIALTWKGLIKMRSMPFWMNIDQAVLIRQVKAHMKNDEKYNFISNSAGQVSGSSDYSLYEADDKINTNKVSPKYSVTLRIELDTKDTSNLLKREKTLLVRAKSDLIRKGQVINSAVLQSDIELEKQEVLDIGNNSARKNLGDIQNSIAALAQRTVNQAIQKLECRHFKSKIIYSKKMIKIDYGLQDGLLPSDIFSSAETGTKKYYFTVKTITNNSAILYALSDGAAGQSFDGMSIQLLERF